VRGLETLVGRGETAQQYNHFLGNPDSFTADLDRYRSTKADRIEAYANEYLDKDKRVEVITVPDAPAEPQASAGKPGSKEVN